MRVPRVSVVIPSYNNAPFIAETMDSVLSQTFEDFELIVSDHASSDGTWEILQRYRMDPRVRLLRIARGGGAQRNWNHVTAHATGQYVKLVCGDDVLAPRSLERQVEAFDGHPTGVVMVAAPRDIVDAAGKPIVRSRGLPGMRGRIPGATALRSTVRAGTNVFGEPCCVLMCRSSLTSIGYWQGTHGYYIDLATYARLLMSGDLVALDESLASFRVSKGQWSVRLAREQARQAVAVNREFRQTAPDMLSTGDVMLGDAMAFLQAARRRAVYALLSSRLRTPERMDQVGDVGRSGDADVIRVTHVIDG